MTRTVFCSGERLSEVTAAGNDRYAEDRELLAELGANLDVSDATGEPSSARVFDAGRYGLEFFRLFTPVYNALMLTTESYDADYLRRYNRQREIGFAAISTEAHRLAGIGDKLDDSMVDLHNTGNSLFSAWQGDSAGSAKGHFDACVNGAEDVRAQLVRLSDTMTVVASAADRICYDLAFAVSELYADRVGPLDANEVSFLVDFGRRCGHGEVTDEEFARAADLADVEVAPVVCRANPDIHGRIESDVTGWLTSVFVPFYEARRTAFDAVCTNAENNLAAAWQGLDNAIADLRADQFAKPTTVQAAPAATAMVPASPTPAAPAGQTAPPVRPGGIPAPPDPPPADPGPSGPWQPPPATPPATPVAPDGPLSGVADQSMPPSGSDNSQVGQPAEAMGGATNYYGGGYGYYPLYSNFGSGDREHKRGVPLTGGLFTSQEVAGPDGMASVIGSAEDANTYNEAEQQATEEVPEKPRSPLEELLADDDLWGSGDLWKTEDK